MVVNLFRCLSVKQNCPISSNALVNLLVTELCYNASDPMSYVGQVSVTIFNDDCLPWTIFNFVDADFPDVSVAAASNFCRNPRNSQIGPWCFIEDNGEDLDFCDVLLCSSAGWYWRSQLLFTLPLFQLYS